MSKSDHYFTFPLIALWGRKGEEKEITPELVIQNCLDCGIVNAGIGCLKKRDESVFRNLLSEAIEQREERGYQHSDDLDIDSDASIYLVGSELTNVKSYQSEGGMSEKVRHFRSYDEHYKQPPYVTMKSSFMWSALETARYERDPISNEQPERSISWNEFRVLCAILSSKVNSQGFTFIGWHSIQARACGFSNKTEYEKAREDQKIKQHLAPPLSHKQIRNILTTLERNRFFIKFRHATGSRGGWSAYSLRHDTRAALGESVAKWQAFQTGNHLAENRKEDLRISLDNKAKFEQQTLDL